MGKTKIATYIVATLFIFTLLASSAHALDTRLNITFLETVNQNVTFAEDFDLIEQQTYSFTEGVVNVSNPSNDTVSDIYVQFVQIDDVVTGFVPNSIGRDAFQVIYAGNQSNLTVNQSVSNSAYTVIPLDIDEDNINDSITHNDTHLIFNVTSENLLFSVPFSNGTDPSLDISSGATPLDMQFNITSQVRDLGYNSNLTFANVTVSGTTSAGGDVQAGQIAISDSARDYAVVHIPELNPTNYSIFNYNVSNSTINPPLNISSEYTNPEFNTKVLAGEAFGVRLSAGNAQIVGELSNVNVTLRAEQVNVSNGTAWEIFNFTLENLSDNVSISDDYLNVENNTDRVWYWTANGGTIPVGEEYNISFDIRAPDTVATSNTYLALTQLLSYQINATASQVDIGSVRASAQISRNQTKRIVSPQDALENNNVTWASDPSVGTGLNISYTLEKVSLWITEVKDPNERIGISQDYYPDFDVNLSSTWNSETWYFNFTDGSSDSAPPPIVWMKPYWIIQNNDNQIVNSSVTVNGTDLYMNYIYVVNGYWLEIDKQVLDRGDGRYDIFTQVYNRGNGHTPQNLTVTVYDFIPQEFSAFNFTPGSNNESNVSGEFSGTAYQWDVGLRTNISTSFSPAGSSDGLDTWNMSYSVNGTGDFQVSDLYIVGLDPRLVDGASSHEGVAIISAIASTSREMLYLAIVVFLIGINLANFMMTSRINRKLGP